MWATPGIDDPERIDRSVAVVVVVREVHIGISGVDCVAHQVLVACGAGVVVGPIVAERNAIPSLAIARH
jgi:hypothetical protein